MLEWVPDSEAELLDLLEAQAPAWATRGERLITALVATVAGRDDFTALAAAMLARIHDDQLYRPTHASFRAFVAAVLPFGLRTAQQMIRVARRLRELGVPHRRVRDLGWSKLTLVVNALTASTVERVLDDVAALSFARLKQLYRPASPHPEAPTGRPLVVTPVVADALARAAVALGDTASPQQRLEYVCRQFLDTSSPEVSPSGA